MADMDHRTLFCHIMLNYEHYATFMPHLYKGFAATFFSLSDKFGILRIKE